MCIGTGRVDWEALSAIGTLAGVIAALALALVPWFSRRGSWKKVSLIAVDGYDVDSGSPTLRVHLFNGGDREIRSVELDIWTLPSSPGPEYRDSMFYAFVHAAETKDLYLGQYQAVPTPRPVTAEFSDWTGRRFVVAEGKRPEKVTPAEESQNT